MAVKKKAAAKKQTVFKTYTSAARKTKVDNSKCKMSPDKAHCFHNATSTAYYNGSYATVSSNTLTWTGAEQVCCFCNMKESELHGDFHPSKAKPSNPYQNGTAIHRGSVSCNMANCGGTCGICSCHK